MADLFPGGGGGGSRRAITCVWGDNCCMGDWRKNRVNENPARKQPRGCTGNLNPPSFRIRQQEELLSQHCSGCFCCSAVPDHCFPPVLCSETTEGIPGWNGGHTDLKNTAAHCSLKDLGGTNVSEWLKMSYFCRTIELQHVFTASSCTSNHVRRAWVLINTQDGHIHPEWFSPLCKPAHSFTCHPYLTSVFYRFFLMNSVVLFLLASKYIHLSVQDISPCGLHFA